mgnify:FL=1
MTRKEIEELTDEEIIDLYKTLDNTIKELEKEVEGDNNDNWI